MSVVGSEPIDALAEKIWHSVGPSGPNKDYLYGLSAAVRQLSPESHDSHLYALEVGSNFSVYGPYAYDSSLRQGAGD